MKLFSGFDAVRFPEENMIFITKDCFLYYIYDPKYEHWQKYRNAGNDEITISNYCEISKVEIMNAMHGVYPRKETDFLRLCSPSDLHIGNMMDILREDYPKIMKNGLISSSVWTLFCESDVVHKSYLAIKELFETGIANNLDNSQILDHVKELCLSIIGRNIFKKEIRIIDGYNSSSYFSIRPVRVIDYSNTDEPENVAVMESNVISIEEFDVEKYLTPYLKKFFDNELKANKARYEYNYLDDDGNEHIAPISGFVWYMTHNFYSLSSIQMILNEITDTIKEQQNIAECRLDFYHRFIYRMNYMTKIAEENGYDLISFMGP